jgi:hypothetical protein
MQSRSPHNAPAHLRSGVALVYAPLASLADYVPSNDGGRCLGPGLGLGGGPGLSGLTVRPACARSERMQRPEPAWGRGAQGETGVTSYYGDSVMGSEPNLAVCKRSSKRARMLDRCCSYWRGTLNRASARHWHC